MPRPSTFWASSITTAFVVVEPRSMPMKQRMLRLPSMGVRRGAAFLLHHLEVALQAVLDVRGREVARIDEVGLDERGRLARALLDLAQNEELPGREAVAALDRVDQEPVGLVLVDVPADHVDPRRQVEVRVAAEAVFRQRFERAIRVVAEAEIVEAADLRVRRAHDD